VNPAIYVYTLGSSDRMKGISFATPSGNEYFYNDVNGFIFPKAYIENYNKQEIKVDEVRATENAVCEYLGQQGWKELILEVTQVCNFRCKYCCYSEHYSNTRSHGKGQMDMATAKLAVDYYMDNFYKVRQRNPFRNPTIAFYGGEPLVNYELIEKVVEYVRNKFSNVNFDFTITTNGLLLTDKIMDFFVENNFSIIVSLDGGQENHDRNRRKADGSESFSDVFFNIERFRKRYSDYERFGISVCVDYRTDLIKLEKFIEENQLFILSLAYITDLESDYYQQFTFEEKTKFDQDLLFLKEKYFELSKNNKLLYSQRSLLLSLFAFGYLEFACHPVMDEGRHSCLPYTGSCIPGEKLYTTVDGLFHMCEKASNHFSIGNVEQGMDYGKIVQLLNAFNQFAGKCSRCDISRFCNICLGRATCGNEIKLPEGYCQNRRQTITQLLIEYTNIMESSPANFDGFLMDYFSRLYSVKGSVLD
jgi:uncharacterized protein